jgi:putative flippase GtrA
MAALLCNIHFFIEKLHAPFAKLMPLQTFRYAITGSINTALDIFLYFIAYNYIFEKQVFHTPFVAISPHIAAFLFSFVISFCTGFILNRNIAFAGSDLRRRVQLFRYIVIVAVCIILNYVFLKIFVENMGFYPTPSKILTTGIVVCFSYFAQKYYSFKAPSV